MAKILVVDDEPNIREVVGLYLRRDGHAVVSAADGEEALEIYRRTRPDLVVLDLMLPKVSGLEVCRRIQAERRVPLIMLTARGEEEDRIVGLGLGADDYVVKPFSPRELVARVRAVLRRAANGDDQRAESLVIGPLRIDLAARAVRYDGREVELTPTELRLLVALARAPNRVLSRQQLLDRAFDPGFDGDERNIDVHMMNLRRKLALPPDAPVVIRTVYGAGYRLEAAR